MMNQRNLLRSGALLRRACAGATSRIATRSSSSIPRMTWSAADVQLRPDEVREVFRSMAMEDDEKMGETIYSHSFNHDEAEEEEAWKFSVLTDPRMQAQLQKSREQLKDQQTTSSQQTPKESATPVDTAPLPNTMEEALRPSLKRAIVVTETSAPFRVVNVNRAWEDLCGYSYVESKGKSLGDLLQGEETDTATATALVSKLLQGEEAGAVLTNYTKSGRAFRNRLRVGPIYDENHNVIHFVGVLQEMKM